MQLRQLRHFVGIAKEGSYTKASQSLNISQPALTRSIQLLEHRLGTTLFLRTPTGVELTEAGATLLRHANLVMNSLHAAQSEISASAKGGYGEVRIGLASLFTNMLAHECLSDCIIADPRFRATVQVGLYERMEKSLRDGVLDIVVSTSTEHDARSDLVFEPLCEVASTIVASSGHELAQMTNVTMEELRDANWVTLNQPHMESFLASFFARSGLAAPKSTIRTSSLELLRNLIRNGNVVGFLPTHWLEPNMNSGRMSALAVDGTPIRRTAGIITRRDGLLNQGAQTFAEQLRRLASKIG